MRNFKNLTLLFLSVCFFFYGVVVETYTFVALSKLRYTFVDNSSNKGPGRNKEHRITMFDKMGSQTDFVFIGDSNTEYGNWTDFSLFGGWGRFYPNVTVSNRGISGDKTSDILLRMSSIVSTRPQKAFISAGINDIHEGILVEEILENYKVIIEDLLEEDIEVVVQSTIQCGGEYCTPEYKKKLNALNVGLRELVESTGVEFLSLGELSAANGLAAHMTYDGTHLNANGYEYWVLRISEYLEK